MKYATWGPTRVVYQQKVCKRSTDTQNGSAPTLHTSLQIHIDMDISGLMIRTQWNIRIVQWEGIHCAHTWLRVCIHSAHYTGEIHLAHKCAVVLHYAHVLCPYIHNIHVYKRVLVHPHTHVHTRTNTCTRSHTHTRTYAHTHTHAYISLHVRQSCADRKSKPVVLLQIEYLYALPSG